MMIPWSRAQALTCLFGDISRPKAIVIFVFLLGSNIKTPALATPLCLIVNERASLVLSFTLLIVGHNLKSLTTLWDPILFCLFFLVTPLDGPNSRLVDPTTGSLTLMDPRRTKPMPHDIGPRTCWWGGGLQPTRLPIKALFYFFESMIVRILVNG